MSPWAKKEYNKKLHRLWDQAFRVYEMQAKEKEDAGYEVQ